MKNKVQQSAPVKGTRIDVYVGLGVFVIALCLYLALAFPQLGDTEFYGIPLTSTPAQFLHQLGGSDSGSYSRLALDFLDGNVSAENRWILNLWPPGIPFLLWFFMIVFGGTLPIVPMVVLTACLWSTALALLAVILVRRGAYVVFALFAAAWLFGPLLTGWTIHDGVISSDGISAALTAVVAIGLYFSTQQEFAAVPGKTRIVYFAGIGFLLGVLSLFRVTWLFAALASLLALAIFLAVVAVSRRLRRASPVTSAPTMRSTVISWGAVVTGFALLTAPWTVALGTVVHPGSYTWSSGDYQWAQLWMTDRHLEEGNASFLVDGEANWACEINPVECRELEQIEQEKTAPYNGVGITFDEFQKRAILTAASHPLEFVGLRSVTTFETWLSVPGQPVGSMTAVTSGLISLVLFLFSCVSLVRDSIKGRSGAFFLLMLAGANLGMVWLTHFETRYMMPLQTIGLVVAALALATHERGIRHRIITWSKERRKP